jgi:hypothetical protein
MKSNTLLSFMARHRVFIFLLATSQLAAVAGLLGVAPALYSVMLFDAPGSERNPAVVALFWSVLTFPVVCFLSVGLAWLAYACKWSRTACVVALLPLVNVVAYYSLKAGPAWTGARYEQVDGEWSYVARTFAGSRVTRLGADNDTFTVLPGDQGPYAKDSARVYLMQYTIAGADPRTFTLLKGPYSRDKERVYCGTVAMAVKNPAAFEVVFAKDGWSIIYDKEHFLTFYGKSFAALPVSYENPVVVGRGWGRDGIAYYYGPARVEGAHYATFRVINEHSAEDAHRQYWGPFPERVPPW